jgi:hypothetical protein
MSEEPLPVALATPMQQTSAAEPTLKDKVNRIQQQFGLAPGTVTEVVDAAARELGLTGKDFTSLSLNEKVARLHAQVVPGASGSAPMQVATAVAMPMAATAVAMPMAAIGMPNAAAGPGPLTMGREDADLLAEGVRKTVGRYAGSLWMGPVQVKFTHEIHPASGGKHALSGKSDVKLCCCPLPGVTTTGESNVDGSGWTMKNSDGTFEYGTLAGFDAKAKVATYNVSGTASVIRGQALSGQQQIDGKAMTMSFQYTAPRAMSFVLTKTL